MGLVMAIVSAICYGTASVLQAVAARRAPASDHVDPRVLMRVVGQVPFLAGLALDGAGFVAQFIALRSLPIFAVQAALAASLAVTAVVAIPVLGLRLSAVSWGAVVGVCAGLALLGISAGTENAAPPSTAFRIGLAVSVPVLALLGFLANLLRGVARAATLGLVGGLCFGVVALAARALSARPLGRMFIEPELYVLVVAGVLAFLFYTIGLQRASVTTVTAALVIGETVLPSIVGVLALGDTTRHGFVPVAVVGFVIAVAGSLLLARYGSLEETRDKDTHNSAPNSAPSHPLP